MTNELLARVGRVAFDIEEGRRPPEITGAVREILDDLGRAGRLPLHDESRRHLLSRIARRLEALENRP